MAAWLNEADGGLTNLFAELDTGNMIVGDSVEEGVLQTITTRVDAYRQIAEERGVDLIAYEGGQHLALANGDRNDPINQQIMDLFVEANRDPRMGQLYRDYLAVWRQHSSGGLFVNYSDIGTPGDFGSWGALEHVGQTTSPKYEALMDYLNQ